MLNRNDIKLLVDINDQNMTVQQTLKNMNPSSKPPVNLNLRQMRVRISTLNFEIGEINSEEKI